MRKRVTVALQGIVSATAMMKPAITAVSLTFHLTVAPSLPSKPKEADTSSRAA
jgi:hypothetical protein